MKKLLTLSLAALMVMAIAIPAFAVDADVLELDGKEYILNTDKNVLEEFTGDRVEPGKALYLGIKASNGGTITSKIANGNRVYTEWSFGKNLVESAKIEQKRAYVDTVTFKGGEFRGTTIAKPTDLDQVLIDIGEDVSIFADADLTSESGLKTAINAFMATYNLYTSEAVTYDEVGALFNVDSANQYIYVVAINTRSSFSVKEEDLLGTVSIGKNKTAAKDTEYEVNTMVAYDVYSAEDGEVEKKAVLDFKNVDSDITLNFKDVAEFTTTVRDESVGGSYKKYMGWNQKVNSTVISNHPMANIDFLTFEATPVFNKIGELKIFTDLGRHVYLINSDGSLSAVEYSYDSIEECIILNTRTLGSYAISDVELQTGSTTTEPTEPSEPSEPSEGDNGNGGTTTKPVPDTGARA